MGADIVVDGTQQNLKEVGKQRVRMLGNFGVINLSGLDYFDEINFAE